MRCAVCCAGCVDDPGSGIDVSAASLSITISRGGGTSGNKLASTDLPVELYFVADANAAWIQGAGGSGRTAIAGESSWNNLAHPSTGWTGGAGSGVRGSSLEFKTSPLDFPTRVRFFLWKIYTLHAFGSVAKTTERFCMILGAL